MNFFIRLHVLHHSIEFLVEFGVGHRLVALVIKLPCQYCSDVLVLGLVGMMSWSGPMQIDLHICFNGNVFGWSDDGHVDVVVPLILMAW